MTRAAMLLPALSLACGDDLILPSPPPPSGLDVRIQRIVSAADDADPDDGLAVFRQHCAFCHAESGEDEQGAIGPGLAAWMNAETDEETLEVVFVGRGSMPGVDLSDDEAADLLAWLRSAFGD